MARQPKKYITIQTSGAILYEFGGIVSPMLHPSWVTLDMVYKLITNGRKVYEHSVTNPSVSVRLTRDNYDDFDLIPENGEVQDPSKADGTYLVTVKDEPASDRDMITGEMYISIVDD